MIYYGAIVLRFVNSGKYIQNKMIKNTLACKITIETSLEHQYNRHAPEVIELLYPRYQGN